MKTSITSFAEFMQRRPQSASAYVNGDSSSVREFSSSSAEATFFPPSGGYLQGGEAIIEANDQGASRFQPGGESKLEILQTAESDGVGYWTGIQRARVRMAGKPEPVAMALRVTEIYRNENGDWRLVHRHADMLAEEQKK
jgi:ketosteroid isomerase-like protein